MADTVELRVVGPDDVRLFDRVANDVFDGPILPEMRDAFLADSRHHMVLAIESGPEGEVVVGMCSGVDFVHPDKAPQLWINEVGVAPTRRRRGIGTRLVRAMVELAGELGCTEAWLVTERENLPARSLYESMAAEEFVNGAVGFSFRIRE